MDFRREGDPGRRAEPERPGSPLAGLSLVQAHLSRFGARVAGIERAERVGPPSYIPTPNAQVELHEGDVLATALPPAQVAMLCESQSLEVLPIGERDVEKWSQVFGLALVLIHPDSGLIGRTTRESDFRTRHGLHIQGVLRGGQVIEDFGDFVKVGGPLLVLTWAVTLFVVPIFFPL
ncbi:MAG: TrkA C-terminal domain-containing protein [Deltaproteobacteria bacterium]|nr:TrkA C-terminal domain-containing protein [Deltaproteobacteria bacterium]